MSEVRGQRTEDRGSMFFFVIFICGLPLLNFITGCKTKAQEAKTQESIPVRVQQVKLTDLDEAVEYVGDIRAQEEVTVYPKVTGKIIKKIKEDGAAVKKGDAIAYIDRDEVGLKFQEAPVESPIDGIIGRVYVDIGTNVSPQDRIALVVSMEKMKINLDIPEKYLARVSLGQKAALYVDAYPEEKFTGEVAKISPVVDIGTRSFPIEITASNSELRLKSGMFAKVSLILGSHPQAALIFKEAIVGHFPDTYVYIVKNNKALMSKITLGISSGPYVEVLDGVTEGDMVVIVGQQRLYDNAPVSVEMSNSSSTGYWR